MIDPRTNKEDFADLCRIAADTFGTDNPSLLSIIEKDYWVTRVLCALADAYADHVVLKGGTSLSKGFGITQRFSEDIDLVVDVGDRGESARDTFMKAIAQDVSDRCELPMTPRGSGRGVHRAVGYGFDAIWSGGKLVQPSVLLEMGTRSVLRPMSQRRLKTLIAVAVPQADDELPSCELPVLVMERTLVEKLFVIHASVVRHIDDPNARPLTRIGRHYYDLVNLLDDATVNASIGTAGFWEMVRDHDRRGTIEFPKQHVAPAGDNFAKSLGLFPGNALRPVLQREYERDRGLFFGHPPSFEDVLVKLIAVRSRLIP